jgi:hypothetical protein
MCREVHFCSCQNHSGLPNISLITTIVLTYSLRLLTIKCSIIMCADNCAWLHWPFSSCFWSCCSGRWRLCERSALCHWRAWRVSHHICECIYVFVRVWCVLDRLNLLCSNRPPPFSHFLIILRMIGVEYKWFVLVV